MEVGVVLGGFIGVLRPGQNLCCVPGAPGSVQVDEAEKQMGV